MTVQLRYRPVTLGQASSRHGQCADPMVLTRTVVLLSVVFGVIATDWPAWHQAALRFRGAPARAHDAASAEFVF